jgi:TRAP-type mannitol/chloroaromatic compound transport system substrate-binding protein
MQTLGVKPTNLQAAKLYDALKTGELDAVDWANPGIDLSMKLFDHAKYYYTGWQEPAVELQFLVNKDAFDKLPKDLQIILNVSMKLAAFELFTGYHHGNITKFKEMRKTHPEIKIRAFPTPVLRALAKETKKELQKIANSGDPLTKEVIESLLSYQQDARQWTRFGDQAYLNNVISIDSL